MLTDFLFVPFTFSMCFAIKGINRYAVLLSAACIFLFVILDLAITWTIYAALMTLSSHCIRASTEAQKFLILAAAEPPCAVLQSNLLFVYNSLTLAIGILLSGFAMLRSAFGNRTAYVGIAAGSVGVLSVFGSFFSNALNSAIILASCLTTLWVIVVGRKLCRRTDR